MSSITAQQEPFPGFTRLAATVWYAEPGIDPASNGVASHHTQPDVILLSTWMSAKPKHILKYVAGYRRLFPASSILLLTNTPKDFIFRSTSSLKQNLMPALRVVQETASARENPNIFLHAFSNGGSYQVSELANLYHQQFNTALPVSSMVLDSAPGRATYGRTVKAMAVGLPQFILFRLFGLLFIHFVCLGMWINYHIIGNENIISKVRRQLLDVELFPLIAPRSYVYSKADEMVGWQDVEKHAQMAEAKGYSVEKLERFDESKHVGHLVADPERYWGIIRQMAK